MCCNGLSLSCTVATASYLYPHSKKRVELRPHSRATMSYLVTASPDPTDPANVRLVVHKRWVGFLLSKELFTAIFTANFREIDPHQLIFELMSTRTPGTTKVKVDKKVWWGQHELNRYTKAVPQRAEVAMWPRPKPDVAMMESEVY